ncbi:hypothetical protein ACHAXS_008886 [Conticribra weissflogii]
MAQFLGKLFMLIFRRATICGVITRCVRRGGLEVTGGPDALAIEAGAAFGAEEADALAAAVAMAA